MTYPIFTCPGTTPENLPTDPWVRPTDWLAMPSVSPTEQKVVLLGAVFDVETASNGFRFSCGSVFTVDWGDGSAPENFSAGSNADHLYDFNNSYLDGTLTTEGYKQCLITITPTSGNLSTLNLRAHPNSYVYGSTSWLDILISLPNTDGAVNISDSSQTNKLLQRVQIIAYAGGSAANLFLNCSNLRSVLYTSTGTVTNCDSMFDGCNKLQEITLSFNSSTVTRMESMFKDCWSLREIPPLNTSNVTRMTGMFASCYLIVAPPAIDTSKVAFANNMFAYCYRLIGQISYNFGALTTGNSLFAYCQSLEELTLNLPLVTDLTGAFQYCKDLKSVSLTTSSSLTTVSGMFSYCTSLREVNAFNVSSVQSFSSMFIGCTTLEEAPAFTTSSATSFASMFTGCFSLATCPAYSSTNVTTFNNMFSNCKQLLQAPNFATSNAVDFSSAFSSCQLLTQVPAYNLTKATNVNSFLSGCINLKTLGAIQFNTTTAPTFSSAFNCVSLKRSQVTGVINTHSYANCSLGPTALDEIYTNLPTVTGKTITVTGNHGVTGDNPSIATAKGWTVTG